MDVKTKFNIGDTLWIMYNNRPQEIKIDHIRIHADLEFNGSTNETSVYIFYGGWINRSLNVDFVYKEGDIGKHVFLTKKDLINSLL